MEVIHRSGGSHGQAHPDSGHGGLGLVSTFNAASQCPNHDSGLGGLGLVSTSDADIQCLSPDSVLGSVGLGPVSDLNGLHLGPCLVLVIRVRTVSVSLSLL